MSTSGSRHDHAGRSPAPHIPAANASKDERIVLAVTEDAWTVVVQPGDSLWQLAQTYGPEREDLRRTVDRIQQWNQLATPLIHPGQTLRIPRKP